MATFMKLTSLDGQKNDSMFTPIGGRKLEEIGGNQLCTEMGANGAGLK